MRVLIQLRVEENVSHVLVDVSDVSEEVQAQLTFLYKVNTINKNVFLTNLSFKIMITQNNMFSV